MLRWPDYFADPPSDTTSGDVNGSTKVAIDDARSELDQMASHLTGGQGR